MLLYYKLSDLSQSANIGMNLRNSCTCTYSSGSSNKIPVEVVVEIVVIIKYMQ